jgi:hypothetical protein
MSKLAEYRKLEQQVATQLAEFDLLKNDSSFQREMEFEIKLRELLREYDYSLIKVINIRPTSVTVKITRKARVAKVYRNPNSGEIIVTKGGHHRQLRGWQAEFGKDVVESWRTQ